MSQWLSHRQIVNPRPEPNYLMLPVFREVLIDEDLEYYDLMNEVDEYRWITSIRRIDWNKYFAKQNHIHELVVLAANSIPNNPVGFLRPAWVDRPLQQYNEECPSWARRYAETFKKAVKQSNIHEMKHLYEVLETLCEAY